jgi:hypothetical protein
VNEVNGIEAFAGEHITIWAKAESAIKASKAATAFAALTWLLFIVTVSVFGTCFRVTPSKSRATNFQGCRDAGRSQCELLIELFADLEFE